MVQTAFEKLLNKIAVSQAQRSQGSTSHQYVRNLLDNKKQTDSKFPWLTDGDFLSGSYARGTKIYPLDDIDVMVVIDGTGLHAIQNGQILDAEVRGDGTSGNPVVDYTYNSYGHISSKMVLETFRDALKESYPDSDIRKDNQAVNVWLESYGMGIDIVPCFHIIPRDETRDFYYIPQGGDNHGWMTTNPKIDDEICEMLDKRHDNKFKSVVKLLKHWNEVDNSSRLRSYHLETVAANIFYNHPEKIQNYQTAIQYFFNNATPYFQGSCNDMTGLGGPIDTYLNPIARQLTLARIEQTKTTINTHYLLGLTTPEKQLTGWRKIYGDTFGS